MVSQRDEKALGGLEGIFVVVEEDTDANGVDRMTLSYLREDIAKRLGASGIPALRAGEWFKSPGTPYLYANITKVEAHNSEDAAFCVILELHQKVSLLRVPTTTISTSTWSTFLVNVVGKANLQEEMRESVSALVDLFIADYQAVNPK